MPEGLENSLHRYLHSQVYEVQRLAVFLGHKIRRHPVFHLALGKMYLHSQSLGSESRTVIIPSQTSKSVFVLFWFGFYFFLLFLRGEADSCLSTGYKPKISIVLHSFGDTDIEVCVGRTFYPTFLVSFLRQESG